MRINEDPSSDTFLKEAFTLLGLAIFTVSLRFLVRVQAGGFQKLRLDDWGMVVAVVCDMGPALSP
jgi:hypothetical protein